ncbi:LicD family protein [Paraglaciecola aquimarina]|uniref:LicD family protein n=1 Tax=Paraglaciecola algarum TaxID=3050085 RepID=A0ABS9D5D7_9ALTE|nr:LicD family protein [Paraglaciecola sp. G1-23]MCF2948125.1 LicD family protein [Paraglaciecola sp. G1-23]
MKERTLLFGAGDGARQYLVNNIANHNLIGFVDNDEAKQGTQFEGAPIYAPSELKNIEFDKIVITTQWALEVQKQLLEELHIEPQKVVLPEKNQLKKLTPFSNQKSLNLAREIVTGLSSLAIQRSVSLSVDFGTLLGIVRDNDIIPWDDDIDFSAPLSSQHEVELLCSDFIKRHSSVLAWSLEKLSNKNGLVAGLLIKFSDKSGSYSEFTTSICFREFKDGNALHMPSLGMWFAPQKHFEQLDIIEWQGQKIQVPNDYKDYLSFQYGDWNTPKKNIQLSDYANLNSVSISEIKEAGFKSEYVSCE